MEYYIKDTDLNMFFHGNCILPQNEGKVFFHKDVEGAFRSDKETCENVIGALPQRKNLILIEGEINHD